MRFELTGHVFCQAGSNNDDVFGNGAKFLDAEINETSENDVARLKEFGHGKKSLCSFGSAELFALIQEIQNFRQDVSTFSGIDRRVVESSSFLENSRFLQILKWISSPCESNRNEFLNSKNPINMWEKYVFLLSNS